MRDAITAFFSLARVECERASPERGKAIRASIFRGRRRAERDHEASKPAPPMRYVPPARPEPEDETVDPFAWAATVIIEA
jgi:hypothetical protein